VVDVEEMHMTSIEWTDKTWNPVIGCSKVSPGCAHCYAEALSIRFAKAWGVPGLPWTPENADANVILKPERLSQPLTWRKPSMVFVNSMSDLFHARVPDSYIAEVFSIMGEASQHTFQVLTKRPDRMAHLLARWVSDWPWSPPANVWLGTSIENRRFVSRAAWLRATPAAVRFISAEPLLGPLIENDGDWRAGVPAFWADGHVGAGLDTHEIDWLIVGGESGRGHRRFDWDWARDLRDVCRDTGTAFFVKQGGGLRPGDRLEGPASRPADPRVATRGGAELMAPLPRALCPVCHASIPVRRNGALREHRDHGHTLYSVPGAVRDGRVPVCFGSGQLVLPSVGSAR
jgi:protein gp37